VLATLWLQDWLHPSDGQAREWLETGQNNIESICLNRADAHQDAQKPPVKLAAFGFAMP
jgi:hypothetical protein